MQRTPEVEEFWRAFCSRAGVSVAERHDVFAFGDSGGWTFRPAALFHSAPVTVSE